jgi:hypothetical protein
VLERGLSKHEAREGYIYNLCRIDAINRNNTMDIIQGIINSVSKKTRINTEITIILIQDNNHKAKIKTIEEILVSCICFGAYSFSGIIDP